MQLNGDVLLFFFFFTQICRLHLKWKHHEFRGVVADGFVVFFLNTAFFFFYVCFPLCILFSPFHVPRKGEKMKSLSLNGFNCGCV